MCFSERSRRSRLPPPLVVDTEDCKLFSETVDAMSCRPSWTIRNVFKQQSSRPGLPRRLYGSAKINLNNYWNVLENLVKVEMSEPNAPKEDAPEEDDDMSNVINENLSNERLEDGKPTPPAADVITVMEVDVPYAASPKQSPAKGLALPKKSAKAAPAKKAFSTDEENKPNPTVTSPGKKLFQPVCPRSPLATVNGMANHAARGRPLKPLSPLSAIADNLARRLCKQL